MHEIAREDSLLYFLTEFPLESPPVYVEQVVRDFLGGMYSEEWVDGWWAAVGDRMIGDLVDEYNKRLADGLPLRYEPVDDIGRKVRGSGIAKGEKFSAAFQEALLALSDDEFELLSARVLQWAGCTKVWTTPHSHDQGLDAFGVLPLLQVPGIWEPERDAPVLSMVAQAKHYSKEKVRTAQVREFVGAKYLAQFETYAVEGKKYPQLSLRPLAPIALVLVTSGEVTRTSRSLGRKAGIFFLSSSDLRVLFQDYWTRSLTTLPQSKRAVVALIRQELQGIPVAG